MECVAGRVLTDMGASLTPEERGELWDSINRAVVAMHVVDFRAAGLSGFGKVGNYAERQVRTWARNYDAADKIVAPALQQPQLTQDMHRLRDYLFAGMSVLEPEPTCVVHGDLGLHNMLIHPTAPRIVAFLDWEISTLGHPLVDLDYLASQLPGGWRSDPSVPAEGAPTAREFMDAYCRSRGLPPVPQGTAEFAGLVNMFRGCAIMHGVLARGLSGTASSGTSRTRRKRGRRLAQDKSSKCWDCSDVCRARGFSSRTSEDAPRFSSPDIQSVTRTFLSVQTPLWLVWQCIM